MSFSADEKMRFQASCKDCLANLINCDKFVGNRFRGFDSARSQNVPFPIKKAESPAVRLWLIRNRKSVLAAGDSYNLANCNALARHATYQSVNLSVTNLVRSVGHRLGRRHPRRSVHAADRESTTTAADFLACRRNDLPTVYDCFTLFHLKQ